LSRDLRNSSVLNARLKVCSDGNDMIAGSTMFQTLAAATGNARSPMVLCNDRGTCNNAVDEDRRRPRDSMLATRKLTGEVAWCCGINATLMNTFA